MASKLIEVESVTGYGVKLLIECGNYDSYTRSVQPLATRTLNDPATLSKLRAAGWPGRGPLWRDKWEYDVPGAPDGRGRIRIGFTFVKPDWED